MERAILPPPIRPGDPAIAVSTASPSDPDATADGLALLSRRYGVDIAAGALSRSGYLAGEDGARAADLQRALDDPAVRAVFAVRGGFGTSRILDRLDFDGLRRHPKWIVGSSDLTALSAHLYATFGLCTIHGPMVAGLPRAAQADIDALYALLEGGISPPCSLQPVCPGVAVGPLIGGNLTVLAHLAGTLPRAFTSGAVFFLEDVGEKPYRLDRCLTQLRRAGWLDNLAGLVLGDFTECDPNRDGVTAHDVTTAFAREANIPAASGYPAAHGKRNAPFIHGAPVRLMVTDDRAVLEFDAAQ